MIPFVPVTKRWDTLLLIAALGLLIGAFAAGGQAAASGVPDRPAAAEMPAADAVDCACCDQDCPAGESCIDCPAACAGTHVSTAVPLAVASAAALRSASRLACPWAGPPPFLSLDRLYRPPRILRA